MTDEKLNDYVVEHIENLHNGASILIRRIADLELRVNTLNNELDAWSMYIRDMKNSLDNVEDYVRRTLTKSNT